MAKNSRTKSKDNTVLLLIILGVISLLFVAIIIAQFFILDSSVDNIVSRGTIVNGVNLSGMDKKDAIEHLNTYFTNKAESFNLTLTYQDKEWSFTNKDFTITSEIHTILDDMVARENEINTKKKKINLLNFLQKSGSSVNASFNYIFVGLDEKLENIFKEIEVEPKNSEILINEDRRNMFNITEDINGVRVDKNALYSSINDLYLKTNLIKIEIPTFSEQAKYTKEYNQSLTHKISEFSTNVSDSTGGRKSNVKLALKRIDGLMVYPNEEFSFNKLTAPHSLENGYKLATIIYNGKFQEGVGGGICQASTTLYNALLLGNLEITEVNKHTLPVKYVPLALDAMVAEYSSDLKFINNTEHPIIIRTFSDENSVSVEIYSNERDKNIKYKTSSETMKTLNHHGDLIEADTKGEYTSKVLYKGEYFRIKYPRDGYEAKSYLEIYEAGKLLEKREIRHEFYQPQNGLVIEGTLDKPAAFNDIKNDVDIIEPNTSASLDSIIIPDTIPTNVCP